MRATALVVLLATALLAAGCGGDDKSDGAARTTTAPAAPGAPSPQFALDSAPKRSVGAPTPQEAVVGYLNALSVRNGVRACRLLSTVAQRQAILLAAQLGKDKITSCPKAIVTLLKLAPDRNLRRLRNVRIVKSQIKGDRATIRPKDAVRDAQLRKFGDRWYISGGVFN